MRVLIAAGACALGMAATAANAAVFEWRYDAELSRGFYDGFRGPYPETANFTGIVRLDVPDPFDLSITCAPDASRREAFGGCDGFVFAGIDGIQDLNLSSDFVIITGSDFTFATDGTGRVQDVGVEFGGDPEYGGLGLDFLYIGFDRGGPDYGGGGGEWILSNPPAPIPLPATAPLALMALMGLGWITRRST